MLCWIHKPMPGSIHEAHAGYNKLHGQFGKLHGLVLLGSGQWSCQPEPRPVLLAASPYSCQPY